jgi:DNA-binding response OmpR family regulator
MAHILVVEDDPVIGANVCDFLSARGNRCDHAADGLIGMALATSDPPDAVVLDLNLPRLDGLTWCRRFRDELHSEAPVVMLTARDELDDKLAGFAAGADDYLVKPFQLAELAARIDALLRRTRRAVTTGVITAGRLRVDRAAREVSFDGVPVRLTPKPFRLIELLAEQPGRVHRQSDLAEAIWGRDGEQGEALRALVAATRRSFTAAGADIDPSETLHGHGYRIRGD